MAIERQPSGEIVEPVPTADSDEVARAIPR
jgi:hypothetical protein